MTLVLAAVAAGCSNAVQSTPTTVTTSTAGEKPTAPQVHRALNIRTYGEHPCALLSPADLLPVGLGNSGEGSASGGQCFYEADPATGGLMLRVETDQSPLSAAYTTDADHYELFEPVTILGYPAVAEAETVAEGGCSLVIGMSDDQGIILTKYPDQTKVPIDETCTQLKKLGEAALYIIGV